MGRTAPNNVTKDSEVNEAVTAMSKQMGIGELDALRVLVGAGMDKLTAEGSARAHTSGAELQFGEKPTKSTIGHELTHTVQQTHTLKQTAAQFELEAKRAMYFKKKAKVANEGFK